MSKSLGTGMNPLAAIETYGADATRYGLMKMASSQDVRFSEGAIEEGRKLANKLWNVARLILQASEGAAPKSPQRSRSAGSSRGCRRRSASSSGCSASSTSRTSSAELYRLTFDDFCDWYAEAIKPRLYAGDADARATALAALERLLKLLHPVMPHVTEEIWSNLPGARDPADRGAVACARGRRRRRRARARAGGGEDVPAQRRRDGRRGGQVRRPVPFPDLDSLYDDVYVYNSDVPAWWTVDERSPEPHRGEQEREAGELPHQLAEAGAAYANVGDKEARSRRQKDGDAENEGEKDEAGEGEQSGDEPEAEGGAD